MELAALRHVKLAFSQEDTPGRDQQQDHPDDAPEGRAKEV